MSRERFQLPHPELGRACPPPAAGSPCNWAPQFPGQGSLSLQDPFLCVQTLRRAVLSFSCPEVLQRTRGASPSKWHLSVSCSLAAPQMQPGFSGAGSATAPRCPRRISPSGNTLVWFSSIIFSFFLFCPLSFFWTKIHPPIFHLSGTGTNDCVCPH